MNKYEFFAIGLLITASSCAFNQYTTHKSIVYGNGHDPQPALIVEGRYREVRLKQPHADVRYLCIETDNMHSAVCLSPIEWVARAQDSINCKEKDQIEDKEVLVMNDDGRTIIAYRSMLAIAKDKFIQIFKYKKYYNSIRDAMRYFGIEEEPTKFQEIPSSKSEPIK